jgi:tRNA nucleotidyltransferase/poly(A) polymerase
MGSDLDRATHQAIVSDNSLAGVSYERIRDELIKGIMSAKSVSSFLSLIDELGLWSQVMPGLNIDDDYAETRNVPVLLALALRHNDPGLVAKRLNALKYTAAEATQVSFLVKFQELTTTNAFRMYKLFLTSGLRRSDVEEFAAEANKPTSSLVAAFVKYVPSVKAVDVMANGYEGQALGREVERRETLLFADMV